MAFLQKPFKGIVEVPNKTVRLPARVSCAVGDHEMVWSIQEKKHRCKWCGATVQGWER